MIEEFTACTSSLLAPVMLLVQSIGWLPWIDNVKGLQALWRQIFPPAMLVVIKYSRPFKVKFFLFVESIVRLNVQTSDP